MFHFVAILKTGDDPLQFTAEAIPSIFKLLFWGQWSRKRLYLFLGLFSLLVVTTFTVLLRKVAILTFKLHHSAIQLDWKVYLLVLMVCLKILFSISLRNETSL